METEIVSATAIVRAFERYFRGDLEFDGLLSLVEGVVFRKATAGLRKRGSRRSKAAVDEFTRDEVVLGVLEKLWSLRGRSSGRFDPAMHRHGSAGVISWLGTICHNAVVSHARKWHRVGRGGTRKVICTIRAVAPEMLNEVVDRHANQKTPTPADKIEQEELVVLLNQCIDEIDPKAAEAIRFRFFSDLSDRDAAKQIGVAPSTLCKRVQKGLRQLRLLLIERGFDANVLFAGL